MKTSRDLENEVIPFIKEFTGQRAVTADQFISRDIGIYGGDGVEVLYGLEERFGVDLRPLIDSVTVHLPPSWFNRLRGKKVGRRTADLTVRQLIEYIRKHTVDA